MKPICVKCERFMRCKKNGFNFTEGMPTKDLAKPGLAEPENWTPYKVWTGDRFECPDCGANIVVGVPPYRIAEHYEPDFEEVRKRLGADQLLVKDC